MTPLRYAPTFSVVVVLYIILLLSSCYPTNFKDEEGVMIASASAAAAVSIRIENASNLDFDVCVDLGDKITCDRDFWM